MYVCTVLRSGIPVLKVKAILTSAGLGYFQAINYFQYDQFTTPDFPLIAISHKKSIGIDPPVMYLALVRRIGPS